MPLFTWTGLHCGTCYLTHTVACWEGGAGMDIAEVKVCLSAPVCLFGNEHIAGKKLAAAPASLAAAAA